MTEVEGGTLRPHSPYYTPKAKYDPEVTGKGYILGYPTGGEFTTHRETEPSFRYTAITIDGQSAEFMTKSAAMLWLAMDYEIKESTAKRKGSRD